MNTQIDNIAMMANDQTGNKFDLNHKELDTFLKKFAELIVRECADVSKNYAAGSLPLSIALAIKKHFGVEE